MDHRSRSSRSSSSSVSGSDVSVTPAVNPTARAFCFAVATEREDFQPLPLPRELAGHVSFGCGQLEKSDQAGELVFRGYVELSTQLRLNVIRAWLSKEPKPEEALTEGEEEEEEGAAGAWFLGFKGTPAYLRDRETHIAEYTNAANRYKGAHELIARAAWQLGSVKRAGQGDRSDFDEIKEILRTYGPQEGIRLVAEKFPGQFVRYPSGITQLADLVVPKVAESADFKLRPWQKALVKILQGPAHDRHIYWIEDAKGAAGKSRLTTYLCRTMSAVELDGRLSDAAFSYTGQSIVIFDLARAVDVLQLKDLYVAGEKLKNGSIFSPKYQSKLKVFKVPHVVYFSNSPPPIGMWSADRLQHIVLSEPEPFHVGSEAMAGGGEAEEPAGATLFEQLLAQAKAEVEEEAERAREQAEQEEFEREAAEKRARRIADRKRKLEEKQRAQRASEDEESGS